MKLLVEVSGGAITNIVATQECSIYLVDHDVIKERDTSKGIEEAREPMQPYFITYEEGMDETPEFDAQLNETLAEHEKPD
jgi:hypothetical protein